MWLTLSCARSALSAEILSETGGIYYVQKEQKPVGPSRVVTSDGLTGCGEGTCWGSNTPFEVRLFL